MRRKSSAWPEVVQKITWAVSVWARQGWVMVLNWLWRGEEYLARDRPPCCALNPSFWGFYLKSFR